MKLAKFDPPGHLDDFSDPQKQAWSAWISENLDQAARGFQDEYDNDGPRAQFYNPTKIDTADDRQSVDIAWIAFPKQVQAAAVSDRQRWRTADSSRDVQDEYCEWSVEREDATQKIVRVTFTCEGPEYWQYLAETTPEKVLDLYREFVSPKVEMDDLFADGRYRLRNRWNNSSTNGAMHLIQQNNTLAAEIELAGGSSVVRKIDGRVLTGEQELIRCGQYGAAGRNSDPHIGAVVNSVTRQRADVTLGNPVGLYFADLLTADWATPDGSDPKSYWRYVRGAAGTPVRAVYEVPTGHGFVVGDVRIGGRPIEYGAQIADFINMKLTGVGCRLDQSPVAPMTGCRTPRGPRGVAATTPRAVGPILGRPVRSTR
jgi:hypothetical protein